MLLFNFVKFHFYLWINVANANLHYFTFSLVRSYVVSLPTLIFFFFEDGVGSFFFFLARCVLILKPQ